MALNNQGVGAEGLLAAAGALSRPSEEFGNDSRVESLWAMKAMEHAEVYFNVRIDKTLATNIFLDLTRYFQFQILCSVDPKTIPRLSSCDDEIYEKFLKDFPNLNVAKLSESDLKSDEAKKKWRDFCEHFKAVDDYSFATLLRLDCAGDYTEDNSIIVTKIQFYAVELARNRGGFNSEIRSKFKPIPRKARPTKTVEGQPMPNMSEIEAELQEILAGKHPMLQ
ncbi:hypothetical protein TCAL_00038 [Tigriopus californicus]|uniref:Polysaccharide biosynthesis domain-containing protein n=1 Tax=Tigriopus californicus TaxID=6832 RepID=A0A553PFH4_TIGCA|nr:hypothetical protein TCAL_00038 [Tigriopus californicus]|eukprot:TCALIF_00038-PA protein Name:"Similar to PBDC1 Protein PBDC1 (Homo sapiens)" AED:0.26 eAED:0.34 QI:0/0/0/0.66/1/1/3/0/222